MSNKQSSVEWYSREIGKITALALNGKMTGLEWKYLQAKVLEEAKAMHKEEIVESWSNGYDEEDRATSNPFKYYNETFNNHETN